MATSCVDCDFITVRKSEVPEYLQSGEFFQSLSDEDNEQISVPRNTLKMDTVIADNKDLKCLLLSLRFWGVNDILHEVVQFCFSDCGLRCGEVLRTFAPDFPYVAVLVSMLPCDNQERAKIAVKSGMLDLIQKLPEAWFAGEEASVDAAIEGHVHILRYLHGRNSEFPCDLIQPALSAGTNGVACIKFLRSIGQEWPTNALYWALMVGGKECFLYALQDGCKWEGEVDNDIACDDVNVETLRYALQHGCPLSTELTYAAATSMNSTIRCLQVLHEMDCPWTAEATCGAAFYNKLDCLRFLHENGCPWDNNTITEAVYGGNTECVKYALQNGCGPIDTLCCNVAAKKGFVVILQYLHEAGAYWDQETCTLAAKHGHLHCLQYLHERGCAWSKSICSVAASNGHLDCLQYTHVQGGGWNKSVCLNAAGKGHIDCLRYAHEHKAPWDKNTTHRAAEQGQLECLKYLLENGCPVTHKAYQAAVDKGNVECAEFIKAFAPHLFQT